MSDNPNIDREAKEVGGASEPMDIEQQEVNMVPVTDDTIAQIAAQLGAEPGMIDEDAIDDFILNHPEWELVVNAWYGRVKTFPSPPHTGMSVDMSSMQVQPPAQQQQQPPQQPPQTPQRQQQPPLVTIKRTRTAGGSAATAVYNPLVDNLYYFSTEDEMIAAANGLDSVAGSGQGWKDAAEWMKVRNNSRHKEVHAFVCVMAAFTPLQLLLTGKRKNVSVPKPWDMRLVAHLPSHADKEMYAQQGWRSGNEVWKRINAQMCFRVGFLTMHHKWGAVSLCESWEAKMGQKIGEITDSNAVVKALPENTRKIFLEKVRDFRAFGLKVRIT